LAEKYSLKDHVFNANSVGQLAGEFAAVIPGFSAEEFSRSALGGFESREFMARLEWLASCVEPYLSENFDVMAKQLEAAMPPELDPTMTDDDFGQFIHAVPGILAVRHGLETYRERALDLLHTATKRFSMEFYIRPFINRWPKETMARLQAWTQDENYHVRRLVSEGTRPKLPWAKGIKLAPQHTLPLLDVLHSDPTRYVTRSVANHLNDISKTDPDAVLKHLGLWARLSRFDRAFEYHVRPCKNRWVIGFQSQVAQPQSGANSGGLRFVVDQSRWINGPQSVQIEGRRASQRCAVEHWHNPYSEGRCDHVQTVSGTGKTGFAGQWQNLGIC